ncbi:MAG TPA: GspE/PulE family protein [Candidatus Sumerlaeota bacterium]|nr:GspE/PulE family protein [Candidatus Sumerlaeota bacterium]HPS02375.1 GspE/PulE family protein [Candidatus Sumerlaeota bacterium]
MAAKEGSLFGRLLRKKDAGQETEHAAESSGKVAAFDPDSFSIDAIDALGDPLGEPLPKVAPVAAKPLPPRPAATASRPPLPASLAPKPAPAAPSKPAPVKPAAPLGRGPQVDPRTLAGRVQTPQALGAVLEEAGLVNEDMIQDLIKSGHESAQSLKRTLIQQGLVSEDDILSAVADQVGMDKINLRDIPVTDELLALVNGRFAKQNHVFPVSVNDFEAVFAVSDPTNLRPLDDLRIMLGKEVRGVLAAEEDLDTFVERFYSNDAVSKIYDKLADDRKKDSFDKKLDEYETIDLEDDRSQPPVVRFVDLFFKAAVHEGASDIHVEPQRSGLKIRFRTDGVLHEIPAPPPSWQNAILSRLKVMSGMDLAEKRIPQDGRIKLTLPEKALDLRVSCLPSIFGETIVMRILDQSDVILGLEEVGFLPDNVQIFKRLIKAPNGVILMTGPTGSGKTTTLNAALSTLNSVEEKIITVEDPVEYMIQGINQIQVNHEVGLDFGLALRSMLRMSPDVIMVGEIRDLETAEIAIRAALTGHLVFSTLHTNDAPSATTRLIDMGVKPFLVASSIQAVIAQRLLRRVCSSCKAGTKYPIEALHELGVDPDRYAEHLFMKGTGCERCGESGYKGRTAIHEIFVMDSVLRKMVIRAESTLKVKKEAIARGMRSLRQDGWEKVLLGQTTIEEVMRITQMD